MESRNVVISFSSFDEPEPAGRCPEFPRAG
jgi:hypothetical protein